jgi:hypothetical protein
VDGAKSKEINKMVTEQKVFWTLIVMFAEYVE